MRKNRPTYDICVLADVVAILLRRVTIERRDLDVVKSVDSADELAQRPLLVLRERLRREDVEGGRVRVLLELLHDRNLVNERLAGGR